MSTVAAAGLVFIVLVALVVFDIRAARARRRHQESADHASVEECLANADHLAEHGKAPEAVPHSPSRP